MRLGLRHTGDGRFFPLAAEQTVLGRSERCGVVLDDEGVVAEHVRLRITGLGIELDLVAGAASVNGYPLAKHFLSRGDEVVLGKAKLTLEVAPDAPPSPRCGRCGAEVGSSEVLCAPCNLRSSRTVSVRPNETQDFLGGGETTQALGPPPKLAPPPEAGSWPEDYEPVALLGEGCQGQVWKLRHRSSGKLVAAKRFRQGTPKAVGRFQREVEALARLDHPGVVGLIDVREQEDGALILMEYVAGPSLATLIARDGAVEVRRALRLGARVADALAVAAASNVVHRDVKPSNILIGAGDQPKLTDFGLVAFQENRTKFTAEGQWIGTPNYMAPEQIEADTVDGRTDVWGLGVTLYHAITGQLPWVSTNPAILFKKILQEPVDVEKLHVVAGGAAELIGRFLTKDREDRPHPDEAAAELSFYA